MLQSADPGSVPVMVLSANPYGRSMLLGLLRGGGFVSLAGCETPAECAEAARGRAPGVLVAEWEDESLNGPLFTRRIRAKATELDYKLPVVLVTSKASHGAVAEARNAGVNEFVVKPVSSQTLTARVHEVILRPREFIDCPAYVGPCRRRRFGPMYDGPLRRTSDPVPEFLEDRAEFENKLRAKARVERLAAAARGLGPVDRVRLRAVFSAAQDICTLADDIDDGPLERSGRSLLRYLAGVGASPALEPDIVQTHVEAMTQLLALANVEKAMREAVADGLDSVVTKKLRRAVAP